MGVKPCRPLVFFITFLSVFLLVCAEQPQHDDSVIVPRPNAKEIVDRLERALNEKWTAEREKELKEGKALVFVTTLVDTNLEQHATNDVEIRINDITVEDVLRNPGKFSFVIPDDVMLDKELRSKSKLEIVVNGDIVRTLPISAIALTAVKVDREKFREKIRRAENPMTAEQELGLDEREEESVSQDSENNAEPETDENAVEESTEKKHQEDYDSFMDLMEGMQTQGLNAKYLDAVTKMADQGNTFAMANLASIYLGGDFSAVRRNVTKGVELLRSAAETGNADAQAQLGFLHASGMYPEIIPKDVGIAVLFWKFAAAGGSQYAKMALAFRYFTGTDVTEDCDAAALLYEDVAFNVLRKEIKRKKEFFKAEHPNSALAEVSPPTPQEISGLGRTRLRQDMAPQLSADHRDIVQYYMHAARRGDPHAQVIVGNLYFYGGAGIPQDLNRARRMFERAAAEGRMDALAHLGFMDLRAGRNMSAVQQLTKAAHGNNKMGHHGMGIVRLHGIGVDKNVDLAKFHFKKAAELRVPEAMYNLGVMLYEGTLVPKQSSVAYDYFLHAANHGHQKARYMVGRMHLKGIEPAGHDCSRALRQFKAVAEQGVWNRILARALRAYEKGDFTIAAYRYAQAAHAGIEVAQFNAAFLHDTRLPNTAKDERDMVLETALELYRMSAAQGNPDGAAKSMLRVGDLVYAEREDYQTAAEAYEKAGRFESAEALFNLGVMHATGRGLKMDPHMAKRYFDKARAVDPRAALPTAIALIALKYSPQLHALWNTMIEFIQLIGLAEVMIKAQEYIEKTPRVKIGPDNVLLGLLMLALALIVNARQRLRVARQELWEDEDDGEFQNEQPARVF